MQRLENAEALAKEEELPEQADEMERKKGYLIFHVFLSFKVPKNHEKPRF